MQANVAISGENIVGTLHYVTDYTGFSGDAELQEGNYIALKVGPVPEGAVVTVEVVNGISGPVALDSDMNCVLRIADKDTQSIKFTGTYNGKTVVKEFSLNYLVLEPEE